MSRIVIIVVFLSNIVAIVAPDGIDLLLMVSITGKNKSEEYPEK